MTCALGSAFVTEAFTCCSLTRAKRQFRVAAVSDLGNCGVGGCNNIKNIHTGGCRGAESIRRLVQRAVQRPWWIGSAVTGVAWDLQSAWPCRVQVGRN